MRSIWNYCGECWRSATLQDGFIVKGDKTPTSIGGELQQFSLGGSPISFQDKASGGLQRCADVLCHAKHDAHLAASTPRRT